MMKAMSGLVIVAALLALAPPPAAAAGVRALPAKAGIELGDPCKFYAQLDGIAPAAVKAYVWDFGDGGTSNEPHPEYVYKDEGTYNVSLTIVLKDGKKLRDTTTVQAQKNCQC